ncbi:MAG: ABC transporter ATP-binding protein [Sulfurimonas sp. RIFOXYD12_FULL_33_39]|uniref:ATP-binding cassette domain-containing protein n=1 Tax=unclassified Sulfurimonas TaxID=2623549 RepID=UPI0008D4D86C|nr:MULTISPECIES: ATP-binding cassette domain-containing protein [unclassified Sulfurimonas]OHE09769.1 MAG: ABC transporter ATP-binding protein [Sulfurimonas sp. RIFOXYD12_FULL_33_39]OHE13723.1 MAG: ABC transporter ATP-binding protein [Sulfurimonas sp. RIFOXYD2_FULL_34_21]DAB28061.1 MAG TPA: ABC transporter ATP-binding protein [Sulfurimonas sp. UBA10385]
MNVSKLHITIGNRSLVDIAFAISSSLALVGQSGSGKSLTIKALLGMLPDEMELELEHDSSFRLIAGESLAFVPQNPFTALSPLTKIKKQFFISQSKVQKLFAQVGLDDGLMERFPPELSGGQLQRVVIAMALSNEPKLILLDEPTTALDPETRVMILNLLKSLQDEFGFKMLFVTHDMNSAKILCEDICVIKDGRVVESGKMEDILKKPSAQYTKILIDANFANRKFRI